MRKIINSTFITLDGVVENPHLWPSLGKSGTDVSYEIQNELLQASDALIMGHGTYESFAGAWPARSGDPVSDRINAMPNYVVSKSLRTPAWNNTRVIGDDVVAQLASLKQQPGGHLLQYGLGRLSFTLLERGLIDEIRLWIHPLVLGRTGSQASHFLDCPLTRLRLMSERALPNGIVIANYEVGSAE
jgi:dihydrofolate reductase